MFKPLKLNTNDKFIRKIVTVFEIVQMFLYSREITENDQINVVRFEDLLFNLKNE